MNSQSSSTCKVCRRGYTSQFPTCSKECARIKASMKCTHQECLEIRYARRNCKNPIGGVAVAVLNKYKDKDWTILLGREAHRNHTNYDELNLCSGSVEPKDNYCYFETAVRELKEEFALKLRLGKGNSFDNYCRNGKGVLRWMFTGGLTPVFILVCPGLSRGPLNKALASRKGGGANTEISSVTWVRLDNGKRLDNKVADSNHCVVSSYAHGVIAQIDTSKL
jgi:8-oxo-dGTP pyrophosphatase MutT (NUDIX family)